MSDPKTAPKPHSHEICTDLVPDSELTAPQQVAAQVLARLGYKKDSGRKVGGPLAAAAAAGVSRAQIYVWLRQPAFENEIERQKANLWLLTDDCLVYHIRNRTSQSALAAIYLRKTLNPEIGDDRYILEKYKHKLRLLEAEVQAEQRQQELQEIDEQIVYEVVEFRREEQAIGQEKETAGKNLPDPE